MSSIWSWPISTCPLTRLTNFRHFIYFFLSTRTNRPSIQFPVFVTISYYTPHRFLIILLRNLSIRIVTSVIPLKALIFTALNLLSFFFDQAHHSLQYINIGTRIPPRTARRAFFDTFQLFMNACTDFIIYMTFIRKDMLRWYGNIKKMYENFDKTDL